MVMEPNDSDESAQRLRDSPNLLAGIIGSAMDAIIAIDDSQRIILFNAAAEKIFACPANEAVGVSVERFIPERFRAGHSTRVHRFAESGITNRTLHGLGTLWGLRATGEEFPIEASISKVESGGKRFFTVVIRDITERQHAEEALRASEERLRLAQQAAGIGAFEWNIQTGVNTWTPELEAMYSLPPGGFGGTQTAFENLVHPDDRARVIELDNWALKTGQPTAGEWRVVWADGSVHWIAGRWQVFMNESGEPSRMVGINIDITDRKQAEQELSKAKERLHLAIDSGSVGGWDFDLKTGGNVWFGKAHAQLGMAHEETLGSRQEFWDRVHEDDREHLRHAIRVAKDKHEEFTEDFRVVWRDGTTHWLRSRGRYHYAANGEPERMLGISLDITQSKQAEEALRESEQRLRLATQAGRMYAYDWDVTRNVVVRSSEHVKILGLTEPMRFPQQQFMDKIHPDDRPKFLAAVAGVTPENPTGEVTYRALASDGTSVWLKSNGRGFFDAEGRLLRVIGMVADVTDQKRAEETLSGMTRKLVEAQEQERARIARELHDDINQRLALLAIGLNQLREKRDDLPSEARDHVLELQQMTADLCSGVYALSHELHFSTLDLLGLPKGMSSWCKTFGERHKIEIDFKNGYVPQLPQEISLCLFRVLQEAVHNAAKHSGVKRVDVQLVENSGEIHLIVRDSGKGFDIEAASQSRRLGLTSMQERVRLVDGTIAIESKPMGGTAIRVRVPIESKQLSQRATV
jgi:PAS domain S-box-containing protein